MTKEETEQLHDSVQLNKLFKPQFKKDTIACPVEIKIAFPKGLDEDNSLEHDIECSIGFDTDFSQLFDENNEKISKEVILALRTTAIAESLKFHDGTIATFIGELFQDMNLILEKDYA